MGMIFLWGMILICFDFQGYDHFTFLRVCEGLILRLSYWYDGFQIGLALMEWGYDLDVICSAGEWIYVIESAKNLLVHFGIPDY